MLIGLAENVNLIDAAERMLSSLFGHARRARGHVEATPGHRRAQMPAVELELPIDERHDAACFA